MKFTFAVATPCLLFAAMLIGTSNVGLRAARGQDDDQVDQVNEATIGGAPSLRLLEPDKKGTLHPLDEPDDTDAPPQRIQRSNIEQTRNDDDAPARPKRKAAIEAASLKGIQPGRSTPEELVVAWGPAKEIRKLKGSSQHFYKVEMFERVMVTVSRDLVESIIVYLDKPIPAEDAAKQLELSEIEFAAVYDAKGQLLGQAFPERGVLFGFSESASEKPEVSQIVIEPIDAQPFMLRAESHLLDRPSQSLDDIDQALRVDPKSARAHWVRAQALLAQGNTIGALESAQTATTFDRHDPEFQLTLAKILNLSADHQAALEHVQQVLNSSNAPVVVRAQAHCQLGDCLAAMQSRDYQQALKEHVEAIKLAEPLATGELVASRRAAKEILLEAHLAVAHDIAWGKWQQKQTVVTKWLDRAVVLAEDLIEHEKESPELRFHVHERALAALAGVRDVPQADKWVSETLAQGKKLVAAPGEPLVQQSLEWRFGLALADALVIEQALGHYDRALEYGQLATEYLKQSNKSVEKWPHRDYVIGRLYYRMGAIYALKRKDHKQAITWYDQAVALLESPVPSSALAEAGRQGETFVSMGVSYWETGARDEAMRLTNQGAKLMEQSVEDGVMDRTALAVPYGNLAFMHQELGDAQHAQEFAELAAKLDQERQKTTQK